MLGIDPTEPLMEDAPRTDPRDHPLGVRHRGLTRSTSAPVDKFQGRSGTAVTPTCIGSMWPRRERSVSPPRRQPRVTPREVPNATSDGVAERVVPLPRDGSLNRTSARGSIAAQCGRSNVEQTYVYGQPFVAAKNIRMRRRLRSRFSTACVTSSFERLAAHARSLASKPSAGMGPAVSSNSLNIPRS